RPRDQDDGGRPPGHVRRPGPRHPLRLRHQRLGLASYPEALEHSANRRCAGIFEPHELRTLLDITEAGPVLRRMTGLDRRVLYELAASTGFRSTECRTLTWGDVDLSSDPPTATVTAKRAKNRRRHDQPLTASLAALLARYKAARGNVDRSDTVIPGGANVSHAAEVLRADMAHAGIDEHDSAGRARVFHSLRHSFCSNLARAGVHPRDAMELMRHSDIKLTFGTYTDASLLDTHGALEALPKLREPTRERQRATGTFVVNSADSLGVQLGGKEHQAVRCCV
ncbi:MAG: site-specific integrase, partial [Planctomycetes bacterium]|nr:site-specific integrase [Planctomycetota bacterium]